MAIVTPLVTVARDPIPRRCWIQTTPVSAL
jgi:hypothetical protein